MGIGYTRQSTTEIQDGETVFAGDLNAEFDLIQDFASGSLGHSHDGTTGEGPKINLATSVTGVLPAANGGVSGKNKTDATTAPNEFNDTSDGYSPGSLWVDITNKIFYFCVDATNGAAIWRRYQLNDAELTAIAGLTSAADKGIQFTGVGTAATYDLTTYAKTLLDDVDAASARATLGLTIGTNVQAYDADLTALASLTSAADKGIQFTGSGTAATYDLTTAGKALLDDASASDQLTTLGVSTFMKTVLDDVDAASARATLGVSESGASQPADATLTALAALDTNTGMIVQTGTDTFTKRTLTGTSNEITVSNGNGVSGNPTVSLPTALTFTGKTVTGGTFTGITDLAIADGGTGASTAANARTNLGLGTAATTAATDYATAAQGTKADSALQPNVTDNLTVGYTVTADNDGTKSSGTYTPTAVDGNLKRIVNGGAFTLAAPSATGDFTLIIQITNNASAGAITLSSFSKTTGDSFTTTNGHDFFVFITKINGFTHAHVQALQ